MAGIKHISASSITLFQECERKWYHRYILGHKGETSDAMLRGTKVHSYLEDYLLKGEHPDSTTVEGQIALTGLIHLPKPSVTNIVEISLEQLPLREPLEVPFKGFIDLLLEDDDGTPIILDHKTTSGTRYMKSEEELRTNTQLIIYAKHVLDNAQEKQEAILRHVYYVTRKPYKSVVCEVRVTRDHVEQEFAKIKKVVNQMIKASIASKELTTLNPGFCKAYNRTCDHYNDCFFTMERRENQPMSDKQKNALAFLRGETMSTKTQEKNATAIGSEAPKEATDIIAPKGRCNIYVGVIAYGETNTEMDLLIEGLQPLMEQVCAAHNAKSIFTIKYKAGWDTLCELIMDQGLPVGDWYVQPTSELWTRLSDVLMAKADMVYMAG